jgi:hypothetical protein
VFGSVDRHISHDLVEQDKYDNQGSSETFEKTRVFSLYNCPKKDEKILIVTLEDRSLTSVYFETELLTCFTGVT